MRKSRQGSALLIVLGFLSFMVVSAVAFSIWMRSERVPSAVFRREAVLRHLAKAGLARAMSEIDDAIRNDPYPGVVKNGAYQTPRGLYVNNWSGRLFSPPDPDDSDCQYYCAPRDETVAVVNLEGLGYLPPFVMNDVRLRQQSLWTSKWRYLDHGAGRCAYVAVNVSDLFDINRMNIDEARTGTHPVTLANLFLDANSKIDTANVAAFDSFVETAANKDNYGNKVVAGTPFVSLLDYNLALFGTGGKVGDFESPFSKWLTVGNTSKKGFYDYFAGEGVDFTSVKNQKFVTDSFFPTSPEEEEQAQPSLAVQEGDKKKRGQPFDLNIFDDLRHQKDMDTLISATFPDATSTGPNYTGKFDQMLSNPEIVALYDYLDRDDIPTSLAMPTVERNPMVVGITAPRDFTFQIQSTTFTDPSSANPGPIETPVPFDLNTVNDVAQNGIDVVVAYPFKHSDVGSVNLASRSYVIQAVAKIFFVKDNGGVPVGTRSSARWTNPTFRPSNSDYTDDSKFGDSVITLVAQPQNVSFSGSDRVAKRISLSFKSVSGSPGVITRVAKWISAGNAADPSAGSVDIKWKATFLPYNNDLTLDNAMQSEQTTLSTDGYVPVCAVWVRIRDAAGTFVADCAPATFLDDPDFNGNILKGNQDIMGSGQGLFSNEPLLRFTGEPGKCIRYSDAQSSATGSPVPNQTVWAQKSLWAVDPRYNFAPEDWCQTSQTITDSNWEDWAVAASETDNRDGDIYMFVSNQGYLQSMGELAFLPRIKEYFNRDMGDIGGRLSHLYDNGFNDNATSASGIAAKNLIWRTYCPWDESDALYKCGIAEGVTGVRVNPYAEVDTLKVALANTPINWWAAAGVNTVGDAAKGQNPGDTVAKREGQFGDSKDSVKCAFNDEGSAASEGHQLKKEDLQLLAQNMHDLFLADKTKTWQEVYDSWDWTPDGTPFNTTSSDFRDQLDNIDCKFLYAFWRNCFANRQQLFIIFVRAESMALGGSGEGNIPPQQGARAVAVVWRDPEAFVNEKSRDANNPETRASHRMRVLFYHQFD